MTRFDRFRYDHPVTAGLALTAAHAGVAVAGTANLVAVAVLYSLFRDGSIAAGLIAFLLVWVVTVWTVVGLYVLWCRLESHVREQARVARTVRSWRCPDDLRDLAP